MKLLREGTRKFESQDLAPHCYPPGTSAADHGGILTKRSPLTHASNVRSPILTISGADDATVPPNQAYLLGKLVKDAGTEVEAEVYDGEGT